MSSMPSSPKECGSRNDSDSRARATRIVAGGKNRIKATPASRQRKSFCQVLEIGISCGIPQGDMRTIGGLQEAVVSSTWLVTILRQDC